VLCLSTDCLCLDQQNSQCIEDHKIKDLPALFSVVIGKNFRASDGLFSFITVFVLAIGNIIRRKPIRDEKHKAIEVYVISRFSWCIANQNKKQNSY
jgi:hypothetical protein